MTIMEPRVAERRKIVSEDRARRRLKWILGIIVVTAVVLGAAWLIRSPVLSIRDVQITGASHSDPSESVSELGMGIGTPTIDVDGDAIANRIRTDPWVGDVHVEVLWPGTVVIDVSERVPVGPVFAGGVWVLAATDGGVIMDLPEPRASEAFVAVDTGRLYPGDVIVDRNVLGALAFIGRLSDVSRIAARVRLEGEGLTAEVRGHTVRLGRPIEMEQKAAVLEALFESGLEPGASVDLIAPSRPGVANSQPQQEVEE